MKSFYMGRTPYEGDLEEDSQEEEKLFDSILGAVGGQPLPGVLGLAQATLSIWVPPQSLYSVHPIMRYARNIMLTAGVCYGYYKSKQPRKEKRHTTAIGQFIQRNGLEVVHGYGTLITMIHNCAEVALPKVDLSLSNSKTTSDNQQQQSFVRQFTLPTGMVFYVGMDAITGIGNKLEPQTHIPTVVMVKKEESSQWVEEIGQVIWLAHGNDNMQLDVRTDEWGYAIYLFSNLPEPGDFVSAENGAYKSVERVSNRLKLMLENGVSRNVLFHGPPGTGKTTIARHVAKELGEKKALRIDSTILRAAGYGPLLKFIRLLRPSVLLIDDFDRLEEDTVASLLHFFEEKNASQDTALKNMVCLVTLNSIEKIDPAFLRPGRFDELVDDG